jgi:hypothetical protein
MWIVRLTVGSGCKRKGWLRFLCPVTHKEARVSLERLRCPSDKVILNPADSLVTGTIVRVASTPAPSPAPAVAKK